MHRSEIAQVFARTSTHHTHTDRERECNERETSHGHSGRTPLDRRSTPPPSRRSPSQPDPRRDKFQTSPPHATDPPATPRLHKVHLAPAPTNVPPRRCQLGLSALRPATGAPPAAVPPPLSTEARTAAAPPLPHPVHSPPLPPNPRAAPPPLHSAIFADASPTRARLHSSSNSALPSGSPLCAASSARGEVAGARKPIFCEGGGPVGDAALGGGDSSSPDPVAGEEGGGPARRMPAEGSGQEGGSEAPLPRMCVCVCVCVCVGSGRWRRASGDAEQQRGVIEGVGAGGGVLGGGVLHRRRRRRVWRQLRLLPPPPSAAEYLLLLLPLLLLLLQLLLLRGGGGGGGKDARWLRVDGPGSGGGAVVRLATRSGVGGGCVRLLRGQRRGRLWRKRLRLRRAREDIRGGVAGGHATGGGDAGRDAGRHARRRAGRRHPARHHEDRAVPQPVRGGLRCGGAVAVLCLLLQQDGLRRGWGRGRLRGRRAARVEAVRVAAARVAAVRVEAAKAEARMEAVMGGGEDGRRARVRWRHAPEAVLAPAASTSGCESRGPSGRAAAARSRTTCVPAPTPPARSRRPLPESKRTSPCGNRCRSLRRRLLHCSRGT